MRFTTQRKDNAMSSIENPAERQPKGDHNRRVALGFSPEDFAVEAGITVDELRSYENTWPDHPFSPMIAQRIGAALDRLEQLIPNSEPAGIRQIIDGVDPAAVEMQDGFDQRVRDTAYFMWESEGRPEGRDQEYWHRAREACLGQLSLDEQYSHAISEQNDATYWA